MTHEAMTRFRRAVLGAAGAYVELRAADVADACALAGPDEATARLAAAAASALPPATPRGGESAQTVLLLSEDARYLLVAAEAARGER